MSNRRYMPEAISNDVFKYSLIHGKESVNNENDETDSINDEINSTDRNQQRESPPPAPVERQKKAEKICWKDI